MKSKLLRSAITITITIAVTAAGTLLLAMPSVAHGAACCGGGSAAPTLISGDERLQFTASASLGTVIGDAPAKGIPVFRAPGDDEVTRTLRFDGALLLTDRFQAGASLPVVQRSLDRPGGEASASGLGDARLSFGYEAMPEWDYSEWRPRGFVFLQLTAPTGRSLYESREVGAPDATGKGFFSVSGGTLFVKRWSRWDMSLLPELHYSFERDFTDASTGSSLRVTPGWGASLGAGVGVSPGSGDFRFGLRVQPAYGQAKRVVADGATSVTAYQLSWDTALEAAYLASDEWSVQAAYVDQTLLGPAVNASLSRTFSLALQRRWLR